MKDIIKWCLLLFIAVNLNGQGINVMHPTLRPATSGGGASPSYPSEYLDTAQAWYFPSSTYITTVNDSVSVWADRTSNERNLTQTTQALRPKFAGDSVSFDGTNDNLYNASFVVTQPFTFYMVVKQVTYTDFREFFETGASDGVKNGNSTPNIRPWNGGSFFDESNLTLNTWHILRVTYDGANSDSQVDNNSATANTLGTDAMAWLYINKSAACSDTRFKEIIIMKGNDATMDATIVGYLNTTYSIY